MSVSPSKKDLGAFYTPAELTDLLCDWSIRNSEDTVLEPSFGGCGFLRSAQRRIGAIGNKSPNNQIYGCDIDPEAFNFLATTFEAPIDLARFQKCDFMNLQPSSEWPLSF